MCYRSTQRGTQGWRKRQPPRFWRHMAFRDPEAGRAYKNKWAREHRLHTMPGRISQTVEWRRDHPDCVAAHRVKSHKKHYVPVIKFGNCLQCSHRIVIIKGPMRRTVCRSCSHLNRLYSWGMQNAKKRNPNYKGWLPA